MKAFPMFLRVEGRRVVIAGGGEQAAQKARLALKTVAEIVVIAPELDPELAALADEGRLRQHSGAAGAEDFAGAALVFVATGCRGADAAWHGVAKAAGALVNVVDQPALCDATTPSIVDRDPVVVAIGTEGAAPVLGRRLKTQIEGMLEPRLGELASLSGRLRAEVARRVAPAGRRAFWRWVFGGPPRDQFRAGRERDAAATIKAAIQDGGAPDQVRGLVSVLGAGTGAEDLMTLRAVQRMQEADTIFHDVRVPMSVMELARRDAARVPVSLTGASSDGRAGALAFDLSDGAERLTTALQEAVADGSRVALLVAGDGAPAFGAVQAGLNDTEAPILEHVPGVGAPALADLRVSQN